METVRPDPEPEPAPVDRETPVPAADSTARLRLNELVQRFAQTPTRRVLVEFLELRRALG